MAFSIRRLTVYDWHFYRALRLKALQDAPEAFTSSHAFESSQPDAWFYDTLHDHHLFGCVENDALLGMAGLQLHRKQEKIAHKGYIWGVYMDASLRGQGAARALMQAVIEDAQTMKLEQLKLEVSSTNPSAMKLYESLGFESYGVEKHALKLGENYIDEIQMVKWL